MISISWFVSIYRLIHQLVSWSIQRKNVMNKYVYVCNMFSIHILQWSYWFEKILGGFKPPDSATFGVVAHMIFDQGCEPVCQWDDATSGLCMMKQFENKTIINTSYIIINNNNNNTKWIPNHSMNDNDKKTIIVMIKYYTFITSFPVFRGASLKLRTFCMAANPAGSAGNSKSPKCDTSTHSHQTSLCYLLFLLVNIDMDM